MRDIIKDANFPRTADGRVYHLGCRPGEIANRIITVGTPSRAETIASYLDNPRKIFRLTSERAFTTITGLFKGTPVSIISIGMGYPNMDFFVRETRECVDGDMIIIRVGSCGGLSDLSVASLVAPQSCVAVTRNFDHDFLDENFSEDAYRISRKVDADPKLYAALKECLEGNSDATNAHFRVIADVVNASADSFYSSQGRMTSFPDKNEHLIQRLIQEVPNLATLEMETFHLYHLATVWTAYARRNEVDRPVSSRNSGSAQEDSFPPTNLPVSPQIVSQPSLPPSIHGLSGNMNINGARSAFAKNTDKRGIIRAAALQMVFAARTSQEFITPAQVAALELWSGKIALEAICKVSISDDQLHGIQGSVWEWMLEPLQS